MEEWRPIKEYPHYAVSNQGRVKRIITVRNSLAGKVLIPRESKAGYFYVFLRKNGKSRLNRVHVLVTNEFLGPIPLGEERHHKDGNKTNNFLENLTFIARSRHRSIHPNNNFPCGEDHPKHKLTRQSVLRIRDLLRGGINTKQISEIFGVSPTSIWKIRQGINWKSV